MQHPFPGQRWISTSEPALGLGIVRAAEGNRVEIHYPAAEEARIYAFDSAPLVRVHFSPGDTVSDRSGRSFVVEKVTGDDDGILAYHGGGRSIAETDLLDSLNFIRPDKRLLAGLADHPRDFDIRLRALEWNTRIRRSPARGLAGARIDLIPHQLAIVAEAIARPHPRLLLADEVGLGKTIEAGLILHRLHLTGRAGRILILVPESLVHQWFIELLRRFNLFFSIYDASRCDAIEAGDPDANPFLESQLILASSEFITRHPARAARARAAGFDLLVVDEAHHLEWSPGKPSAAYAEIESLAREIPSLLLLTATPRQLGPAGHFARLRLLDPDRYPDLDSFLEESQSYAPLAEAAEALKNGDLPENLDAFTTRSPRAAALLAALRKTAEGTRAPKPGQPSAESLRSRLASELIDFFGTGRVLFRNTRDRLSGFPGRQPHLHALPAGTSRCSWLAELLRSLPPAEKVLLITDSPESAIAAREDLLAEIRVESALFHENLTLVQRDRNAAWFADPEGARILVCSEIGSEGRNFQFARHLVLFGLPRDPELLEQRIGRLDRIGQTGTIHIHVPYPTGSAEELHARWLHEGLDAFSSPLKGATALAAALLPELDQLLAASGENKTPADNPATPPKAFDAFLKRSRELKEKTARALATGHDRLLELGAPPPEKAAELIEAIQSADNDPRFERFALRLFDHLGLDISDISLGTYHLHRGQRLSEAFAGLPEDGLPATFSRDTALSREDLAFLTPDHPLFLGALEQLLDGESGNSSFAHWQTGEGKAILLECVFLLESLAPTRLHLDRFLPPTAIRVTVDHRGAARDTAPPPESLRPGNPHRLVGQDAFRRDIFPKMLAAAKSLATTEAEPPANAARNLAKRTLDAEIQRLEDLSTRNPKVSETELAALRSLRDESLAALASPRLRLDALRLVWRT